MRFIETVARELDNHVPHVLSIFFAQSLLDGSDHVRFVVRSDDFLFFLTDRFNTSVRSGKRNLAQPVKDLHNLFLVNHHAVGLTQDLFQHVQLVLGWLATVLHIDVLLDHAAFERSRSVQSVGRNNIVEMVRLHLLQQITNPAALQLEHAAGVTCLKQFERLLIVQRKLQRVNQFASGLFDQLDGVAQNR